MTIDFLRKVLPEGMIVIAKPAEVGYTQKVCSSIEEAAELASKWDAAGNDCYFGLGGLIAPYRVREKDQKKEVRVGANIKELKCLFLDLDVDPDSDKKYASQLDAVRSLRQFCREENFPSPMLVNSGGGIHAYWPFDEPMPADSWRKIARLFKGALAEYGLKSDPTRTADASSVLRVVGTHNYKHGGKRPVALLKDTGPYTRQEILSAVVVLADKYKVTDTTPAAETTSVLGDNTKKEYPVSSMQRTVLHCAQLRLMVNDGGESEPLWLAGLQIARLSENPQEAALLISQAYPGFHLSEMQRKLTNLADRNIGPSTCDQFKMHNASICDGCAYKGKITSPIQLGHARREPPAPRPRIAEDADLGGVIVVSDIEKMAYPYPYGLDAKGRVIRKVGEEQNVETVKEDAVVHDYEIKALKRTHSERFDVESSDWVVKQPIGGWTKFTIEQSLLSKPEGLHSVLLSKGIYLTPGRTKLMVSFMIAYIKELQKSVETERMFSRIGWRDEYSKFVLGGSMYDANGTVSEHQMSPEVKAELPGLRTAGTLEGWVEAMQFLNAKDHEAHRFMFYAGFGSPLLHMTGHKGVIINGTGAPGAGKTTAVSAAVSIFGHPVDFIFNGTKAGSTVNAMYSSLAARNNLPFGMDEITRIDPKVFGEFCLSVSQGMGKVVNTRAGTLSQNRPSWAAIVLTTANTDVYSTLGQSRADAAAEAMRVLQVPFTIPEAHSKAEADAFLREIKVHHGLAGHAFMQYVTQNYALVEQKMLLLVELIDKRAKIASSERFWSGAIASNICGAMVARKIGLIPDFPIEADFEWACNLPAGARGSLVESLVTPQEIISEYLETCVGQTLVVSQTIKAGMSVRVDQAPRGALYVRHEADADLIYVTRSEFKRYCVEIGANYGAIQKDLETRGVLIDRNKQVVLGKGTDFGKGQVRCWEIDMKELRAGGSK